MAPTLTPGTPPVASLRGELRYGFELARLLANRDFLRPARAPAEPAVLLVPGFMAGDQSLGVLAGWLRRRGSRTERAGIVLNADCAERAVGGIESRLHRFAEEAGGPVVLIGQSRGGELARVVALRNPDLVSSLVMLGSPVLDPLRVGPVVLGAVRYVARLGDLGVPGMFSSECGDGACCARFREDLLAPLPAAVRAVSIYSRSDGIVAWEACLDPIGRAHRGGVEPRRHVCQRTGLPGPRRHPRRGGRSMDWMSPMDASFLHIEGPMNPMHIGGVSIFEGPAPPFEDLEEMVDRKLGLVPRYRQKVRFIPLGLGRPVWVDDPHFNLSYHLRHSALPPPGTDQQLRRTAARIFAQRLDRGKPLWEIWMVEGLSENRWALLSKVHHCMVDGVSATDLMSVMFGQEDAPEADRTWEPDPEPNGPELSCAR